jgi:hypothetical protein
MNNEEIKTDTPKARRSYSLPAVIILLVLTAALTFALTVTFMTPENRDRLVTEEEYATIERYSRLDEVYGMLTESYYIEPDSDALLLGAVDGMVRR